MAAKKKGIIREGEIIEHKGAHVARKVDSTIAAAEVLTSGDPQRMERWAIRKIMGKASAWATNKAAGLPGKIQGKRRKK